MANLAATNDLSLPIDRQDLFNMWAQAALGNIQPGDLAPGVFTFDRATHLTSATTTPEPGHAFYSQVDELLYIFHDEVDDTGVSLWLAVGPDRFDVACLAAEPIPAGAIVNPTYDRWVEVATQASDHATLTAIGANQQGINSQSLQDMTTSASGTWIPVAVDGIVWGTIAAGDIMEKNRWVRIANTEPGSIVRASSATFVPNVDDSIGLSYQDINNSAGTTAFNAKFIWSGPKLWRAFI